MKKSTKGLIYISSAIITIGTIKLIKDISKEREEKRKNLVEYKVEEYYYNHIKEGKYTDIDKIYTFKKHLH